MPTTLLTPGDPGPAFAINPGARSPFLLVGDHAGRLIPHSLKSLGLSAELDRHIAWDIGVAGLARHLAADLNACFIGQAYSRLVIDCNRAPGSAQSIPKESDGTFIPGNAALSRRDRQARVDEIYRPYQEAISLELQARREAGLATILIALHSFTPVFQNVVRPWRFGVLHHGDSHFSKAVLAAMTAVLGAAVGDNQPYAMDETDHTVPLHQGEGLLDYLELEVRQDLIGDEAAQQAISETIASFLRQACRETAA